MQCYAVLLIALWGNVTWSDYADKVCRSMEKGIVVGNDKVTASDGNVLSVRFECNDFFLSMIQKCSLATVPKYSVAAESTAAVIAESGARIYDLTCRKTGEPTLEPSVFFKKFCDDDMAAKEKNAKSDEVKGPEGAQASKDVTDDVALPQAGQSVKVAYTLYCFDQPRMSRVLLATQRGSRLKSAVSLAAGKTGYIMNNGIDYELTCNEFASASISVVKKTFADELCKAGVSAAWDQTVKSNYATYPSDDKLLGKYEATLTAGTLSVPIQYTVECFGEPVRIQQCSYAGASRLKDTVAIPPGKNGAYIIQNGKDLVLTCNEFTAAQISKRKTTGADEFCEDAIQQKETEKKSNGAAFSLNEQEETTNFLSLERPSIRTKIKVEVKALCFGDRPILKSCRIKRKKSKVVSAGHRSECVDVSIGPMKAMTRLESDEFATPRFTTKDDKRC